MSTPGFKSVGGVGRIFQAMRYSAQGFQAAFLHEAAFRQELLLGLFLSRPPSGSAARCRRPACCWPATCWCCWSNW